MISSRLNRRFLLIFGIFLSLAPQWVYGAQNTAAPISPPAPILETGTLGNADFRIEIPANWNGNLVLLAHGYEAPGTVHGEAWPQDASLPGLLAAGYAVALSGYSSQGWAVHEAIHDVDLLQQYFIERHGVPRHSYLVGRSMGGAVAAASLQQYPDRYDGALSMCSAMLPGAQMFAELLTTLVAFDYFYPQAKGLPTLGLSAPAADPIAASQLAAQLKSILPSKPQAMTALAQRLEVSPDRLAEAIATHYLIYQDMSRRADGIPVDNRDTVYTGFGDDQAFNAGVRRYQGSPTTMEYAAASPQLGSQWSRPLVIQYDRDDPITSSRFRLAQSEPADRAAARLAPVVLPAETPDDCGASMQQTLDALKVLDHWVSTGKRPSYR